ncbi:hypothetical protein Y032_0001g415 [Ancylostoma ceylanicum]|uniref:Uncharacterized protein n=1 Tax=Ancylostoma ceylanicum TaxID=53326 RepID=A0A016W3L5_9BILA|nr:hypothetical protein Y032_0001g415 [Ancylostoma ceylanicum]
MLDVDPRTVRRAISRFRDTGGITDRPRSGRPRTAVVRKNVEIIRKRIGRNPKRSMRKMAEDLKISDRSVRRIVQGKLNCRSYRLQKCQALTSENKHKRVEICRALLERAADGRHLKFVFSDEKLFTVQAFHNRQNDRILSESMEEANRNGRLVPKKAHPQSDMVASFITSDGNSPLIFVDSGVKINRQNYLDDVLKKHLIPWLHSHFGDRPYTFQQDGAPAHTAKMVQEWCRANLSDFIAAEEWPPCSPDLNPLDYSIWSILEAKACATSHSSVGSLKAALLKAWEDIDLEYLRRTVDAFPHRLRECIRREGDHIEHL